MESDYLRMDDVLRVLHELDIMYEQKNRYRLLGRGIHVEIIPLKRGFLESTASKIVGDIEAEFNPPIKEIIVEGYDNLLDHRIDGGKEYVKAYLDSMGLKVKGPRKKPHIYASISGDQEGQALGQEIESLAWKILIAQYQISKFPDVASSAFGIAAKKHFDLEDCMGNTGLYFSN